MRDFRDLTSLGQLTSGDAIGLASAAAEAIRGLNHATRHQTGLGQPAAAYEVIGCLSRAASGLGQLFAQITRYLDDALAAGRLGHDLGEDPARAIDAAAIFLGDAAASAAALASDLGSAQQQLAAINGGPTPREHHS
jgi:hypothetical protein